MRKIPPLNRWQKIGAAALLLCLILFAGCLLPGRTDDGTANTNAALRGLEARVSALEARHAEVRAQEYLLLEHEGKIGIFSAEKNVLYEIVDVRVSTLPARDREMLTEGITVVGEAALRAILEDYSS